MNKHVGTAPDQAATQQNGAVSAGAKPVQRSWRLPVIMLICLIGSAVVSFVVFKYVAPSIPRELVGVWQVTEGKLEGATLDFRWYGTAIATQHKNGKKATTTSDVKVEGKRIFLTNTDTGHEDTVIQTIISLTENELVFRDQDNITYRLVRIGN